MKLINLGNISKDKPSIKSIETMNNHTERIISEKIVEENSNLNQLNPEPEPIAVLNLSQDLDFIETFSLDNSNLTCVPEPDSNHISDAVILDDPELIAEILNPNNVPNEKTVENSDDSLSKRNVSPLGKL